MALPSPSSVSNRGFTLVESLVALLVLSTALLLALPLIQQQPGIVRRLDIQHIALTEIDSTLEALRSGAMPLQTIHLPGGPGRPVLRVDVEPAATPPGLFLVTVRALWKIQGKDYEKKVETMIWSPPPPEEEAPEETEPP